MDKDFSLKVSKHLQEVDSMLKEAVKHEILPDRAYTQITTKIGLIETNYLNGSFKEVDEDYYQWVKLRLEKISGLLVSLKKHSSASFNLPNEDLMHVTGDYYNEDNSISLTPEIRQAVTAIINETYSA